MVKKNKIKVYLRQDNSCNLSAELDFVILTAKDLGVNANSFEKEFEGFGEFVDVTPLQLKKWRKIVSDYRKLQNKFKDLCTKR